MGQKSFFEFQMFYCFCFASCLCLIISENLCNVVAMVRADLCALTHREPR